MQEIVIDGSGKILGRIASSAAKLLINGNKVYIVNAEKILISGHRRDILEKYKKRIELKDKANPEHSPYWPRRPDMFVKRVIRGMLPFKQAKGKNAYKLLRVYMSIPKELEGAKFYEVSSKPAEKIYENTYTIEELMGALGYNR